MGSSELPVNEPDRVLSTSNGTDVRATDDLREQAVGPLVQPSRAPRRWRRQQRLLQLERTEHSHLSHCPSAQPWRAQLPRLPLQP